MEIEHEVFRRDGFFFDAQAFRLDLYRLLSSFFSSGDFARLSRATTTEPLSELAAEQQESEITRLLVAIAATIRVIQDRDQKAAQKLVASCGYLIPDLRSRAREPLSIREACNKIIHARRFNFDAKPLPAIDRNLPNPTRTLRPFLHLYGKQRSTEWKAELNIVQFATVNAVLIRG